MAQHRSIFADFARIYQVPVPHGGFKAPGRRTSTHHKQVGSDCDIRARLARAGSLRTMRTTGFGAFLAAALLTVELLCRKPRIIFVQPTRKGEKE